MDFVFCGVYNDEERINKFTFQFVFLLFYKQIKVISIAYRQHFHFLRFGYSVVLQFFISHGVSRSISHTLVTIARSFNKTKSCCELSKLNYIVCNFVLFFSELRTFDETTNISEFIYVKNHIKKDTPISKCDHAGNERGLSGVEEGEGEYHKEHKMTMHQLPRREVINLPRNLKLH